MKTITDKIITFLQSFIPLLVEGKYIEIEKITGGKRLTGFLIDRAIKEYGKTLSLPPRDAYELVDIARIKTTAAHKWSVVMPLWTEEEGRSDLSMEITLTEIGDSFDVELDDIHVL